MKTIISLFSLLLCIGTISCNRQAQYQESQFDTSVNKNTTKSYPRVAEDLNIVVKDTIDYIAPDKPPMD